MNKKILSLMIIALVAASAFAATLASPAATVYLTKRTVITTTQLQSTIDLYAAQGTTLTKENALQALINEELAKQGMERAGFVLTDEQKAQLLASQKASIESSLGATLTDEEFASLLESQAGMTVEQYSESLAQQYCLQYYILSEKQDMFSSIAEPTEAEIKTFFRKNQSQFVNPEAFKIAHIFFAIGTDEASDAKALESASKVYAEITSGAITFEKAVSQYSEDTSSASKGGEMGWLTTDDEDSATLLGELFVNTVYDMDSGDISAPVKSNAGYHIIKVISHTPFTVLTLDSSLTPEDATTVRAYISQKLLAEKQSAMLTTAYQSIISDLTAEATIKKLI